MAYQRGLNIFSTLEYEKGTNGNNHERDENMTKMMTPLDFLSKHGMGSGLTLVNLVGTSSVVGTTF